MRSADRYWESEIPLNIADPERQTWTAFSLVRAPRLVAVLVISYPVWVVCGHRQMFRT